MLASRSARPTDAGKCLTKDNLQVGIMHRRAIADTQVAFLGGCGSHPVPCARTRHLHPSNSPPPERLRRPKFDTRDLGATTTARGTKLFGSSWSFRVKGRLVPRQEQENAMSNGKQALDHFNRAHPAVQEQFWSALRRDVEHEHEVCRAADALYGPPRKPRGFRPRTPVERPLAPSRPALQTGRAIRLERERLRDPNANACGRSRPRTTFWRSRAKSSREARCSVRYLVTMSDRRVSKYDAITAGAASGVIVGRQSTTSPPTFGASTCTVRRSLICTNA